jgi:hypothetical protein
MDLRTRKFLRSVSVFIRTTNSRSIQNFFDFIHVRNLSQSISDWPKLLAEVYKCAKPGGWVEIGDLGCSRMLTVLTQHSAIRADDVHSSFG